MQTLIELTNVSKSYGDIRALDDVSLSVGPGITGLLGPNGSGKSTLIKALLGLVRLNAGQASILGWKLPHQANRIRRQVGYMPENDCYIPGLTGVEMVHFGALLSGLPEVEGLRRSHEILDFCGIEQERYRQVESYSTGMRQKLKFAQAIVHDPKLLILDEPTTSLDPEERDMLLGRIRVLVEKTGKSVLISTHILPDVQAICDRVTILVTGRIRLETSLSELNQTSDSGLYVRVVAEADRFVASLNQEGLSASLTDDGSIAIQSNGDRLVQRIWKIADEQRLQVRSLTPVRHSLQEVFVRAVQEATHATH